MKIKVFIIITLLCVGLLGTGCNNDPGPAHRAIELGGEWFLNNQNKDFIYYEYDPFKKAHSDDSNAVREMASMWAIGHLGHFLNDERYDQLARKGLHYFEPYFKKDAEHGFYYVNVEPETIRLAYSAFAILSLLEVDDYLQRDYYLGKLAEGIQFHQKEDGSLSPIFFSDSQSNADYYPGEALLALMSLYEKDPRPSYLETVQKAFPYYRDYWKDHKNSAFVPWHTQAYLKLYQVTENHEQQQEIADFIFEMNDFVIKRNGGGDTCEGFKFNGIGVSVYTEGMNRAYEMAKQVGDKKRMKCYENFIKKSIDAMIALQFTKENNFNKPTHQSAAIGGFLESANGDIMRVDQNQHSVFALMGAYELGLVK